jgi:hypothetical protein
MSKTPPPTDILDDATAPEFIYKCCNCGTSFLSGPRLTPYCGLRCHNEAKAVRYTRKKTKEFAGVIMPDDIRDAIAFKIAHALSGGYDAKARRVAPEMRAGVTRRDNGKCQLCSADGREIDHIDGPSSDMQNLRLLCSPCHRDVTRAHLRPIQDPRTLERNQWLRSRIDSPTPVMPCDGDEWITQWSPWVRATRQPRHAWDDVSLRAHLHEQEQRAQEPPKFPKINQRPSSRRRTSKRKNESRD